MKFLESRLVVRRVVRLASISIALSMAAACSTTPSYPPAPSAAPKISENYRYLIGSGDTLNINVWRNPELSTAVTVRPDGRISTPLVDDLQAAGRNSQELAREIEKALARFIREPVVTVVVNNFQGAVGEQIRIIGEAAKPQSVPYRANMTLLDVMILAGGLTEFADGNSAVLVRGAEGGKSYGVRVRDLVKRGDISANVEVLPGDVLIIPQSWF